MPHSDAGTFTSLLFANRREPVLCVAFAVPRGRAPDRTCRAGGAARALLHANAKGTVLL
jgi:hypothetical protein